jgi:hypothetical protein
MSVVCGSCGSGWIEMTLSAQPRYFCKKCGATDSVAEESSIVVLTGEFLDPVRHWPGIEYEGHWVEATFRTAEGFEGWILGQLKKVGEIDDDGEFWPPVVLPMWHIETIGGEVCWHDVLEFRFSSAFPTTTIQ